MNTRLPVLSFDDLKVPPRLRKSIEKELGGEEILWLGRPTPSSLMSSAKIGMIVGVIFTLVTLGGMVFGFMNVSGTMGFLVVGGIGGMVLLTMALPMATMPIWVSWLINYRDCYVMTSTRAIVFDNEKVLWATPKPFTGEELAQRHLTVKEDGTGSIIFDSETVRLGYTTTVKTRTQEKYDGTKEEVMTIKRRQNSAEKPVGFMDIAEVEAVEAMLRAQFRLGPPAGKDVD